ncbi:unnamed protein product [Adineta ricciae]|uniref:Uncharacterized protein n=1 Tax=Adineta ricciae TaxID=249248 RepID=A0A815R3G6_ADIRI|nr:unnamed protein product [Adineta ricciae]
MNNRVRIQKKVYTPTSTPEPECFLCQVIETGESIIVPRSSMKRIYDDTAEILFHGRRMEATIEYRGTHRECRRVWENKGEGQQFNDIHEINDSDKEIEDDDEPVIQLRRLTTTDLATNPRTPQQKRKALSPVAQERRPSSASSPFVRRKIDGVQIHIAGDSRSSDEENNDQQLLNFSSASSLMKHIDVQFKVIREENEKQYTQLSKKIDRKYQFDTIDISSFRESNENARFDDVVYKDINLTRIRSKDFGDYARLVLRQLYSREELVSSILPPGGSQYARKPLDSGRFEYLHDALRSKYHLAADKYDEFYSKLVRPKLADFLNDERKRGRKANKDGV